MSDQHIAVAVACPRSEVSEKFFQGMADRMAVSFHKYGPVRAGFPHHVDALKSLNDRLRKYDETGNTEFLIDAANFAMIEFMAPARPDAFYRPTDADESPGRRSASGRVTASDNRTLAENL